MPADYNKILEERHRKEMEKKVKQSSLERQLKMWKTRQAELRNVALTALDKEFVKKQLDKCDSEIEKINRIISTL